MATSGIYRDDNQIRFNPTQGTAVNFDVAGTATPGIPSTVEPDWARLARVFGVAERVGSRVWQWTPPSPLTADALRRSAILLEQARVARERREAEERERLRRELEWLDAQDAAMALVEAVVPPDVFALVKACKAVEVPSPFVAGRVYRLFPPNLGLTVEVLEHGQHVAALCVGPDDEDDSELIVPDMDHWLTNWLSIQANEYEWLHAANTIGGTPVWWRKIPPEMAAKRPFRVFVALAREAAVAVRRTSCGA